MQWPPTKPGLKSKKFHFDLAAFSTSEVLIFILSNIIANSFIKAILTSLCVFSITFAASATLIEGALYVPTLIIFLYKLSTITAIFSVDPLVTLTTLCKLYFSAPGLILSGL